MEMIDHASVYVVHNRNKINFISGSMYRLHNTSEHSGVTNMYSLSNAGTGGSTSRANTPVPQLRQPQHHPQHQQQYLIDGGDHVSLMQQQYGVIGGGNTNGGISHSYTLPHNLSQQLSVGSSATLKAAPVSGYNPQHHRMHHTLQRHCNHNLTTESPSQPHCSPSQLTTITTSRSRTAWTTPT